MSTPDLSTVKVGDTVWILRDPWRGDVWTERFVVKAGPVWLTVAGSVENPGYGERFRRDTGTAYAPGKGYGTPDKLYTKEMRDEREQRAADRALIRSVVGQPLYPGTPNYSDPSRLAAVLREAQEAGKL